MTERLTTPAPTLPFSSALSALALQTPGRTLRHVTLNLNRPGELLSTAALNVTVRWPGTPYPQLAGQHIHPAWLLLQLPEMVTVPDSLSGDELETAMDEQGHADDTGDFNDSDERKRRILQLFRNFERVQFEDEPAPGPSWMHLAELVDLPPEQAHQQLWLAAGSSFDPNWAIRRFRYCWEMDD